MSEENKVESIFGWIGAIISIYFYFAPGFPFYKVLKDQMNYQDLPVILLISSFLNCVLWADYGLIKNSTQIYITNSFGGTITLIWITIYLLYLGKKYFVVSLIINIIILIATGAISFLFYFIIDSNITGLIAMIFNILMYAAPGEKIIRVIKTKKYELIPIYSSIGGFLCSLCWLIFGFYQNDKNLIIPNSLGILFSAIQILIFLILYCKSDKNNNDKSSNSSIKDEEKNKNIN
jgi:solute carrier family 50 protein (sugar transporter)